MHTCDIFRIECNTTASQKCITDVENCSKHLVPTSENSWTESYLGSVCVRVHLRASICLSVVILQHFADVGCGQIMNKRNKNEFWENRRRSRRLAVTNQWGWGVFE
ncbi:hypothetical protein ILYODFUR_009464 [Ilyodon furcidens]|uniref:Uncharacterized protein n=1 Tax=Ilyodon furcidens TaxID=33524 RepID=A0ABV0TLA1_9TELE